MWPDRPQNRAPRTLRDGVGALLGVFLAATLVMVTAVIVVGSVDRLWILAPVMLVDFATTFGVVTYIMRLLADDGESPTVNARWPSSRRPWRERSKPPEQYWRPR